MTCTSQGNENRTEGKNMEELFLPAPSQWNVCNIQKIYSYRKSTPPQEMISSRSYLTNHPHQKIQNGNRQREKEISSYERAFIWEWSFSICQPYSIFRVPLDVFWQGRELILIKRIHSHGEVFREQGREGRTNNQDFRSVKFWADVPSDSI